MFGVSTAPRAGQVKVSDRPIARRIDPAEIVAPAE